MTVLRGKRTLVTGGSGFIGSHLVRRLIAEEAQVFCLAVPDERSLQSWPPQVSVFESDIRDRKGVNHAFYRCQPEVVFHLAAAGVTDAGIDVAAAVDVNVAGTVNVLKACRHANVDRLVHVGTSYEYCEPTNAYVASKFAAWAFVQGYAHDVRFPAVCLRLFHAYGPAQPAGALIAGAIIAASTGEDFDMTPGKQVRDLIHVEDVVDGIIGAAIQQGVERMTLDLGTGCGREVGQVARLVFQMSGRKDGLHVGARRYRNGEVMHLVADADRTERLMGWKYRVELDEGLRKTMAWYRTQLLNDELAD